MATPQAAPRPVSWNVVNDQQIMVTNDHEGTVNDFLEVLDDIPWPAAFTDQSDSHKQKEVSEDEYTLPLSERLTYIRHTEARTFLHGSTNAAVQKHLQEWRNARAEQRFVMFLQMHQYQTYDRERSPVVPALRCAGPFIRFPEHYHRCPFDVHLSTGLGATCDRCDDGRQT
ncbi:hypothetical protein K474DRAFT_881535 [Panus rudis PR-1116 ss-1]|nr:hypothetical protein K474DRAFT_881535 [Panus rudis PR-1116 ss-1]